MLHVADTNQLLTQPSGLSAHGGAKGNEDMGGQPQGARRGLFGHFLPAGLLGAGSSNREDGIEGHVA